MRHTDAMTTDDGLGGAGCAWFALCPNNADGTVTHPILGEVPTCKRCADKAGQTLNVPDAGSVSA